MSQTLGSMGTNAVAAPSRVAFGILGPIIAEINGRQLDLGGPRQRGVLVVLLLSDGRVVSVDQLIDDVWGVEAPSTVRKMVQVYMSRLRQQLVTPDAAELITTHGSGYRLEASHYWLDAQRVRRLTDQARQLITDSPREAIAKYDEALGLWRGRPLVDMTAMPFALSAVAALDDLRDTVLRERVDAYLAAGQHDAAVSELRQLAAADPTAERPVHQLMLALYRSGRQVEALAAFSSYRRQLSSELGLEPTQELRELHGRLLNHDATLVPTKASPAAASSEPSVVTESTPPASEPPVVVQRSRFRRSVAAVGLAVVLAATGATVALTRGHHASHGSSVNAGVTKLTKNSVAVIDPSTQHIVADVPVGQSPTSLATDGDLLWVANLDDHTVSEISLRSMHVIETFGLSQAPVSIAASDGDAWVSNAFSGTLSRILATYNEVTAPFFPGTANLSGNPALAARSDRLWVALSNARLLRLDPSSVRSTGSVQLPTRAFSIATDTSSVWAIPFSSSKVYDVDARSLDLTRTVSLTGTTQQVALAAGSAWVTTASPNRLWRIDESTGQARVAMDLGRSAPVALAASPGGIYVATQASGIVHDIDPQGSRLPTTLNLGRPVAGLVVTGRSLAATLQ